MGIIVSRLTSHSPQIAAALLGSDVLRECIARVGSAGCEVQPVWANGAFLLVPLTEELVLEHDLQLEPHNIVMLATDYDLVAQALMLLPKRQRPQLKPEHRAEPDLL